MRGSVVSAAVAALLAASSAAVAQECTASVTSPAAVWATMPDSAAGHPDAPLKVLTHLVCRSCSPQVSMELSAGAARALPLGQLTGMAWARAVYDSPANREGFRQSVLRSELRSSPGCRLDGTVTGVAAIGNLGMVGTRIDAACANGSAVLSGEFYSGYDGTCLYQVQLIWGPGRVELSTQGRDAVRQLLKAIQFGD